MSNSTGRLFKVVTFGSSHGRALGAVIDGCPAGLELSEEDIQIELDMRRPGRNPLASSRLEDDQVEILSGVFDGRTDGTPIAAVVYNKDHDSSSYDDLKNKPRPGHGDFCWMEKYGNYDYYGGGRGSGRCTIGHVIGGAVARKLLKLYNIDILAHVTQVGTIKSSSELVDLNDMRGVVESNNVRCADLDAAKDMEELILKYKESGDSVGGVVEIIVTGLPVGLGGPVFDKLDGDISRALMSIGSVKGVEIGLGFDIVNYPANEVNDEFRIQNDKVVTRTNNCGGVLGGMSTGSPLIARMAVKPTPSISKKQCSVDMVKKEDVDIKIKGRHDPCICPRVTVVGESAISMVLVDHMLCSGFIHPDRL